MRLLRAGRYKLLLRMLGARLGTARVRGYGARPSYSDQLDPILGKTNAPQQQHAAIINAPQQQDATTTGSIPLIDTLACSEQALHLVANARPVCRCPFVRAVAAARRACAAAQQRAAHECGEHVRALPRLESPAGVPAWPLGAAALSAAAPVRREGGNSAETGGKMFDPLGLVRANTVAACARRRAPRPPRSSAEAPDARRRRWAALRRLPSSGTRS